MDKVWFKLRQTHYPPAPEAKILAGDGDDSQSAICLGHIIPDLGHIDFPINSGAVVAFPSRMTVFQSHSLEFRWQDGRKSGLGLGLGAGGTLAGALGLMTVKASIRLAFQRSVEEYEEFDRLDTYIVQLNRRYVDQCLETDEVKDYVGNKRDWAFFIITGVKIARAGQRKTRVNSSTETGGGPQMSNVPAAITAEATAELRRERPRTTEEKKMSDFVWAVRLAKVHKGTLMTDWSIDPFTRRATFGTGGGDEVDVGAVVLGEGVDEFVVVDDEEAGEAVVLLNGEGWKDGVGRGVD
ncbi:hypothetical protein CDD80_5267 [Ophiocordyceps camponoti-rufipedis]|uniref:Uncharacterized protein n=1 Tax=Ophiocordyceps camponoti-rufipedis TaxID=2004952 RepID=A0A2C5ZHR7_9HYPO|nr:hypothetical protein CDD80_5267 [Ophiocordyceps camponoti-rufipedis]